MQMTHERIKVIRLCDPRVLYRLAERWELLYEFLKGNPNLCSTLKYQIQLRDFWVYQNFLIRMWLHAIYPLSSVAVATRPIVIKSIPCSSDTLSCVIARYLTTPICVIVTMAILWSCSLKMSRC